MRSTTYAQDAKIAADMKVSIHRNHTPRRENITLTEIDAEIRETIGRLPGAVGIATKTLNASESYFHNEHMTFSAASTIKIHVLLELFNQIRKGEHSLDEPVRIPLDRRGEMWGRDSSGILKEIHSVERLSVRDMATLMIVVSDNVATNLVIDLLGMENIQNMISALGLRNTRLQRKMMNFESAASGLDNYSTPFDMMTTLHEIAKGQILDKNFCSMILDILGRSQGPLGMRRSIPNVVTIEHKTGEMKDACHDVGIVRAARNPFILCVMTKTTSVAECWDTIARLGRIFYNHFNETGNETS